jgi:hypothetical protein
MTRCMHQFVRKQLSTLHALRFKASGSEDDVAADRVGMGRYRFCRGAGAFVSMHPHVREIVAQQSFHVALHFRRHWPAVVTQHFLHNRRRHDRSRSGCLPVEPMLMWGGKMPVGVQRDSAEMMTSVGKNRARFIANTCRRNFDRRQRRFVFTGRWFGGVVAEGRTF